MSSEIRLKVSELNKLTKQYLEESFHYLLIEGEISNLKIPSSGHYYFTLKDDKAQVRAILFQSKRPSFAVSNGMQVLVRASITLYEPHGDFQLIIHHLSPLGLGTYHLQFTELKNKLEKLGWFAVEHKRTINLPKSLGIITSPSGAVIKDILTTLQIPLKIIIYPASTQGRNATSELSTAIKVANYRAECDLLIIARGGGNSEDLSPFNQEELAYNIFNSKIPIISAVGHETDFSIADFVADYRALTPTAAAEFIVYKYRSQKEHFLKLDQTLRNNFSLRIDQKQNQLSNLKLQLKDPEQKLRWQNQRLKNLQNNFEYMLNTRLSSLQNRLTFLSTKLQMLNPEYPLQRGFSLLLDLEKQIVITNPDQIVDYRAYRIKLQRGEVFCKIVKIPS